MCSFYPASSGRITAMTNTITIVANVRISSHGSPLTPRGFVLFQLVHRSRRVVGCDSGHLGRRGQRGPRPVVRRGPAHPRSRRACFPRLDFGGYVVLRVFCGILAQINYTSSSSFPLQTADRFEIQIFLDERRAFSPKSQAGRIPKRGVSPGACIGAIILDEVISTTIFFSSSPLYSRSERS